MNTILNSENELTEFFKSNPDKLIGLSKGFNIVYAKLYDDWSQIPHDLNRLGIFKNGKKLNPPRTWQTKENKILSHVGRE